MFSTFVTGSRGPGWIEVDSQRRTVAGIGNRYSGSIVLSNAFTPAES